MVKRLYTAKSFRTSRWSKSSVMKDLLSKPEVARVLSNNKKKRQIWETLKENDAYTKKGFAKAMYVAKTNKKDAISAKAAAVIGKAVLGSGIGSDKRYIASEDTNIRSSQPSNVVKFQPRKTEIQNNQNVKQGNRTPLVNSNVINTPRIYGGQLAEKKDSKPDDVYSFMFRNKGNASNNEDQKAA
jgi:hypothetical protein